MQLSDQERDGELLLMYLKHSTISPELIGDLTDIIGSRDGAYQWIMDNVRGWPRDPIAGIGLFVWCLNNRRTYPGADRDD